LEVKKPKTTSPKGRLSKVQKKFHKKIEAAGGHVEVVYSLEDVIKVIDHLMISVDKEYKFIEDQWWAKV